MLPLARAYQLGMQTNLALGKGLRALPSASVPLDYTRFREFAFVFEQLAALAGPRAQILDVSSPKLFPLTVAKLAPAQTVHSIDILEKELLWIRERADYLALQNLEARQADVRALPFDAGSFDILTSISAIEHVAPAETGDRIAADEMSRVLKDGGHLVLTLPFSQEYFAEYRRGEVYERRAEGGEEIFFQRFYDKQRIEEVFGRHPNLRLKHFSVVHERFIGQDPHKRWAKVFSKTRWRRRLFSPWYPLLSHVLLSPPTELSVRKGRPYLACLVLQKF